jgi:hypothetical protein
VFGVLLHLLREILQEGSAKLWRQHGCAIPYDPKLFVVEAKRFNQCNSPSNDRDASYHAP